LKVSISLAICPRAMGQIASESLYL